MALSTYQQMYEFHHGFYEERITDFKEDGYNLKFSEYFILRLTGSSLYDSLKAECAELNLSFIENAIPDGEGEKEYLDPSIIKDQMKLFLNSIESFLSKGIKQEDERLLKSAKQDAEKLVALCEFAEFKNLRISIGLDA
jgi:hypothetical protein